MSHKLIKENKQQKQKYILKMKLYCVLLFILSILFITVWINIFITSNSMKKQVSNMVEGVDYYYETVTITDKKIYTSSVAHDGFVDDSTSYCFFYNNEKDKKFFVDERTYETYNIHSEIKAYTLDHETYKYKLEQLCPDYTDNEIKKALGVVLGAFLLILLIWIF